ncbi:Hsp20/alpha crystallin family protein [Bacillus sp. T3]|uniref:Hsp20/alpha crystallin family protein n=1 Tax=Bacillus sp. T3 TaxID=467262 RepID=UPI002981D4F0|nr:Hsp20/alpha crystallin family protein [Bacillus sp. T3]
MTNRSLRRRNREFGEMWDSFNDFFGDHFLASVRGDIHQFRTDIKDSGDHYVIEAEMPGFEKEAINIDYEHNYLTISAKRETNSTDEKENFIRQERHYGEFVRRFFVEDIDENKIEATFTNGVLTLNCPKRQLTGTEHKRIEIH